MTERRIEYVAVDQLVPAEKNPKAHNLDAIAASIREFGVIEPAVVDDRTGRIVSGHGRSEVYELLSKAEESGLDAPDGVTVSEEGTWLVPVVRGWASTSDEHAQAAGIAVNRLGELGGWVETDLAALLQDLDATSPALRAVTGYSDDDLAALLNSLPAVPGPTGPQPTPATLAERFLVPPFSVLDARQGYWQDRKRAWLSLGIKSEVGRPTNLLKMSDTVLGKREGPSCSGQAQQSLSQPRTKVGEGWKYPKQRNKSAPALPGDITLGRGPGAEYKGEKKQPNRSTPQSASGNDPAYFWKKQEAERQAGREMTNEEFETEWWQPDAYVGGTSIFDPVLCELAYRWWCPAGGRVLDPFAGGSVRGIVAASLGRHYEGVDLRPEQVEANEEQLAELQPEGSARWLVGDAREALPDGPFDFVLTCPPYYDLEQYSDDPMDLSNAPTYAEFCESYADIIAKTVQRLAEDRFACVVVGDVRDGQGIYRSFVPDTIRLFTLAGMGFYNDAVLVTAVGSLALRAARIFGGARKLAKGHQNVLLFVKGDPKRAGEACAPVEIVDVAELFGEVVEAEA